MGLSSFVAKEPRALPVFILADASYSMHGAKINELNLALRDMITSFQNVDDIRGKFQVSVITFGGTAQINLPLTDVEKVHLSELAASGNTPMGAAFDIVRSQIEDRNIVSSKAYTPTIVLVSDGIPTDCDEDIWKNGNYTDWEPLVALQNSERCRKCQRLALGIGDDADVNMLKAFVADKEIPVIRTKEGAARGITKFFKWVTMSTIARMNSVNPNLIQPAGVLFDLDDEDIII